MVYIVIGGQYQVFACGIGDAVIPLCYKVMTTYILRILLAGIAMITPPVLSTLFIRKFIADKPRCFFWFWYDEKMQGRFLRKPKRKGGVYAAAS